MTAHSPGPWHHKITDEGDLIVVIPPHEQYCCVLGFGDMENTEGEDHANARLIAAAPDLLAALEALVAETMHLIGRLDSDEGVPKGVMFAAEAAILRATEGWES